MYKVLRTVVAVISFLSILIVLKLQSDYFSYQKDEKTKNTLFEMKQKILDFKYLSLEDIEAKQLNTLYRINKQAFNLTKINFLESDLINARDFIARKKNIEQIDKILKDAQAEISKKKEEIHDPIIRLRFENIESKIKILLGTDGIEQRLKRISEIKEDAEMLKNDLMLQRKVKVEGSLVLRAFNNIIYDLDQVSTILTPLMKYKKIDAQIKKNISSMYQEISLMQNNIEKEKFDFSSMINLLSGMIIFCAFFFVFLLLRNSKRSNKDIKINRDDNLEEEKNNYCHDKIELKLQLNIIQEMLDQNIALVNKSQEIVWCSREFLNLFRVSDIEKLSTKFSCSPPSWPEIFASFSKTHLNRYQIKGNNIKEFEVETRKINSLKYDEVVVIKPIEIANEIVPLLNSREYLDLYHFIENWLGQNIQFLASLNISREKIHLKHSDELVFINSNTGNLPNLIQKTFEVFSIYFIDKNLKSEISISLHRDTKNAIKIQYFIPDNNFNKINENVIKNNKVYPSAVVKLREMENQFVDLGVRISLKQVYSKEKKLKGGMIVVELSSSLLSPYSYNKKSMMRAA